MKRVRGSHHTAVAVTIGVLLSIGCSSEPTCEDALNNSLKVTNAGGIGGATYGMIKRSQFLSDCREKKWNAGTRSCFAQAATVEAFTKCLEAMATEYGY